VIRYTVDDIMREEPCSSYAEARVRALWGRAESLSPGDIARLPISVEDRMWALLRLLFRLSPHRAYRVARLIALDVLDLWGPPDIVVWFLGSGDERARAAALGASWAVAGAAGASRSAVWITEAFESAWALRSAGASSEAVKAAWTVRALAGATRAARAVKFAGDASWETSMRRYLSWVVKAFDPFTLVGGLL